MDVKAIDWRLRPPFGSFKEAKCFNDDFFRGGYSEAAREFSMDLFVKEMDEAGVAMGVVPFRIGQDQEDIGRLVDQYPGRFAGFAYINPYDEDPLAEIDRMVVNGKASGIIVEPGQFFLKKPLTADDKLLYPIYQKCQDEGILMTITFGGLYCAALEYYNPIYIDRVALDFPKLKMVLGHGGWPYVTEICHIAYQRENIYLAPDAYMFPIHPGYQDYVTAANNVLQDKIVFGSCFPSVALSKAMELFRESGVKEEVMPKILYHNAAKLLGLSE